MIIGLSYKMGSGKDLVADYLVKHHFFTKISFAKSLKEAVRTIFGFTKEQTDGDLKEVEDSFWGRTPRWIMQTFGTEACRNNIDKDIWVKSLHKQILRNPELNWIISDARFINEVKAIKKWGGRVIKIDRPNNPYSKQSEHSSEVELDSYSNFDWTLTNLEGEEGVKTLYKHVDEMIDVFYRADILNEIFMNIEKERSSK
jgi:hypothetical protein